MEKNFSKTQTPPRSSQTEGFAQIAANELGMSPPKFHLANSPGFKMPQLDEHVNDAEKAVLIKQQRLVQNDTHFGGHRSSLNSLNQNIVKADEAKFNYDNSYGYEAARSKPNTPNNNNNSMRLVKNYQEQSNNFFNDLYNNPKSTMQIFIDDLEEETILDVNFLFYSILQIQSLRVKLKISINIIEIV